MDGLEWKGALRAWPEVNDGHIDCSDSNIRKRNEHGIDTSTFYKKKRSKTNLSPVENYIRRILLQVSQSEASQSRKLRSSALKNRVKVYEDMTCLRLFPLQGMAIQFFNQLMNEYHYVDGQSLTHNFNSTIIRSQIEEDSTHSSRDNDMERNSVLSDQVDYQPSHIHKQSIGNNKRRKVHLRPELGAEVNSSLTTASVSLDSEENVMGLQTLWSMEPRIFATETSVKGKRKYIVGNLGRFLYQYWVKTDPQSRHYYEVIRENTPCRLYFDLEFCKRSNPHLSCDESEILLTEFIVELCTEFQRNFGITISRSNIIDLDSTTIKKFSRHLIVHLPDGELFSDAHAAGSFVKRLVERLANELSSGILAERHPTLARNLFVNDRCGELDAQSANESASHGSSSENQKSRGVMRNEYSINTKRTCFIDLSVYTRNRLFRLMGSSKFGKPASASLKIAAKNEFKFPSNFGNDKFYPPDIRRSISSLQIDSSNNAFYAALDWETHADALSLTFIIPTSRSKMKCRILGNSPQSITLKENFAKFLSCSDASSSKRSKFYLASIGTSPLPKLDKYILTNVGCRGGTQGYIRAWSIERLCKDDQPDTYILTYQMSKNRWCENIGRAHKSNNIMWSVNLNHLTCWQTCHDHDCRGFCGCLIKLHDMSEDIRSEIDEYLFDQELLKIDEKRPRYSTNEAESSLGQLLSESELDRALSSIDLAVFHKL